MRVLILGSSGLLGSKLLDKFSRKTKTLGTFYSKSHKAKTYKNVLHLDVSNHNLVESFILEFRPDVIIYSASVSRPDLCEENAELAESVNFLAVKNVASICSTLGVKLVYISTDYVFDGKSSEYSEEDKKAPLNVYGETKKKAEEFLLNFLPNCIIVRSGLVFGYSPYTEGRGFLHNVMEKLQNNEKVEADNELLVYPILADDISENISLLIDRDESGVFHIANDQCYTKFTFAKIIAKEYGLNDSLVRDVASSSKKLRAKRPRGVFLSTKKIRRILGSNFVMTTVSEAVKVHRRQFGCMFRLIYSVRPDMLVAGQNASEFRIGVGKLLAKESPIDTVDCVIPIPESGIYSATGVSAESGKPLFFGLIRDYFTEKTLYSATSKDRYQSLQRKLIPVESVIFGKKVALVDEAVLSGATLSVVVERVKAAGAAEVHVRIPSPIMTNACNGRVLPSLSLAYEDALIEKKRISIEKSEFEEFLAQKFGVSSFKFLSTSAFMSALTEKSMIRCADCFLGEFKNIHIQKSNYLEVEQNY